MKLWKRLVGLFFLLVLVDGALRKWAFPGTSNFLYVLKDVVLIGALILFATRHRLRFPSALKKTWLPTLLGAYGFWVSLEACNLQAPNFAVSLFGVKAHLLYISLLVLVPAALPLKRFRGKHIRRYVFLLVVPIMLLGIYQFFQSPTHWVNQYVSERNAVDTVGLAGHARITGPFSYFTGMDIFLVFNICLGYGVMLAGLKHSWRLLWLGVILLGLSWVVAPMTGSRSTIVFALVPLPLLLYVAVKRHRMSGKLAGGVLVVGLSVFLLLQTDLSEGWMALSQRAEQAGGAQAAQERIEGTLMGPIKLIDAAGFTGYGSGTAHQAASRLVSSSVAPWMPSGVYFEGELERVTMELGVIGLLLYLLVKLRIALLAFNTFKRARGAMELGVGASACAFSITRLAGSTVYSVTAGALYWGLVGLTVMVWCAQQRRAARVSTLTRQVPTTK